MTLPVPPQRNDGQELFAQRGDAFMAALPAFEVRMEFIESDVTTKQAQAAASQVAALASENAAAASSGATIWVSGTTYAIGNVRWSPVTYQSYRRKTAGAGTTDPSADTTNWAVVTPSPAQAGNAGKFRTTDGTNESWADALPAQTGNAGKFLQTNGTTASWINGELPYVAYASRSTLRAMTPIAGDQLVVEGIGVFVWVSGSTAPDDDETAFVTTGGAWELIAAGPDWVELFITSEIEDLRAEINAKTAGRARILRADFDMTVTSVAANTATMVASAVNIPGAAVGDLVFVSVPTIPGTVNADIAALVIKPFVLMADTVVVYLTNPTGAVASLSAARWGVSVIKK